RTGVYMLQEAFRRMGLGQDPASVGFVRRALAQLPQKHYARWYIGGADELKHDAAVVDTFLHAQDRAYTVPQVLEWVERAGLVFQHWADTSFYYPQAGSDLSSESGARLAGLPERDQWAAVEMLKLECGMHVLLACRPERDAAQLMAPAPGEDWMR